MYFEALLLKRTHPSKLYIITQHVMQKSLVSNYIKLCVFLQLF